jgi:hypothetical protein
MHEIETGAVEAGAFDTLRGQGYVPGAIQDRTERARAGRSPPRRVPRAQSAGRAGRT